MVCRELVAQLTTEFGAKLEEIRKDIDAKMTAQHSMLLDAVARSGNRPISPTLQPVETSASGHHQVFDMAKSDIKLADIEAKMEGHLATMAALINAVAAAQAGKAPSEDESCHVAAADAGAQACINDGRRRQLMVTVSDTSTAASATDSSMPTSEDWARLASTELGRSRVMRLRELIAAPASGRAMVARMDACGSSSEEEEEMAVYDAQSITSTEPFCHLEARVAFGSEVNSDNDAIEQVAGDEDEEEVSFISEFADELDRLMSAAKKDPAARGQARRLIVSTARRIGIPTKDLIANLRVAYSASQ